MRDVTPKKGQRMVQETEITKVLFCHLPASSLSLISFKMHLLKIIIRVNIGDLPEMSLARKLHVPRYTDGRPPWAPGPSSDASV